MEQNPALAGDVTAEQDVHIAEIPGEQRPPAASSDTSVWFGLWGPGKMPPDVLEVVEPGIMTTAHGAPRRTFLRDLSVVDDMMLRLSGCGFIAEDGHLIHLNGLPKWLAKVPSNTVWRQAP